MRKVITINIPEPCHEDWNKMTPKDQGRHCAVCSKTVIDFTIQTDEQIIKSLESEGKLCGRFKKQQLDREIVLVRKDKNNYLSLAASGLFAFLAFGNQDVYAQGTPHPIKVDTIIRPTVKGKVATSILNERIIIGKVTTAADKLALPGATVIVKGTKQSTNTDFDGNFKIKVKVGDIVVVRYVGMFDYETTITNFNRIDAALEDGKYLDEVVYVGYVSTYDIYAAKRKAKRKIKRKAIKNGEQERTAFGKFFFGIKRLFTKK